MGNRSSSRQQQGLVCPSETNLTDFQLVRFIGAGTFGKVFVFLHKGLKKEYALKIMCKRRICRRKFAENVLSELELLQGLSHPFISSLWYAFQDCDYIYMISDLLLGGDLSYHLKNQGRFSESRAKLLICELALALDYLHRQRVGHFDVKPANILLDDQGHAHLSDFGLARHLAEGELVTAFCGTRPYMAPEILLTALEDLDGYDWRVDWWALGVCFYEMLRGRTPHEYPASFSSLQVLSIVFTRAVTMPSRWPSDLIAFLRGVVNPDQRLRIDTFEKFRQHLYMERIKWRDVFDRKMVPIFVPPKEHVEDFSRRNYRATISMPLSSHRMARHRSKHLMRHLHLKDEHQQSSDAEKGQQSLKELDEEVVKLSARFKKYNRFRCETKIAEPRQSLDYMMDHSEVLTMAAATLPPMPRNGDSSNSQRKRTASRTRSPKLSSSVRRTEESSSGSGRPFLQADRVRMFHKNNREVNYSM